MPSAVAPAGNYSEMETVLIVLWDFLAYVASAVQYNSISIHKHLLGTLGERDSELRKKNYLLLKSFITNGKIKTTTKIAKCLELYNC